MNNTNNILVTGATGLLGSSLVPHLKKCGYKVLTHALSTPADFKFDLSDKFTTEKNLDEIRPSLIVNLVGLTNVELCETQVNLAYLTNTLTVENLANWIESTKLVCLLLQISTDHIYDGMGLNSEDQVKINNNYAFSKYAGELAALRAPSTILRTNFVGRSLVSNRASLSDWVYKSLKDGKKVQVLDDVYFSPLTIRELVDMIELVIQKPSIGIYNLGSHFGLSKADFAFCFAECLKLPTNNISRILSKDAKFFKAYRPKDMRMDVSSFEVKFDVKLPNFTDLIQLLAQDYDEIS
jgi:dTDP-4-dehydrorhamnose reductase